MIRALVDPVNLALLCCPARIETSVPSLPVETSDEASHILYKWISILDLKET